MWRRRRRPRHLRPARVHPSLGPVPKGRVGGEAQDREVPVHPGGAVHRGAVLVQPASTGGRAAQGTRAEALGTLRLLRHHRQRGSVGTVQLRAGESVVEIAQSTVAAGQHEMGGPQDRSSFTQVRPIRTLKNQKTDENLRRYRRPPPPPLRFPPPPGRGPRPPPPLPNTNEARCPFPSASSQNMIPDLLTWGSSEIAQERRLSI